ncbi:hypothetical protein PanWU01x14_025240 [Parasponia andersonii]|uniref:Hydroxyproline-rich glycoprotein family protein n=1 Tax=Parasponia andersonii TaxID=3476 RepID=A0A2P5DWV8_PARAD|nr:hypothetical protein PanWU01x14_025240 [Parasponia andersonii]
MMNILLLLAFLVFLAISPAHARILPAETIIPQGEMYDMIISIYGEDRALSPPPPPSSSTPINPSTGACEPCDDVVKITGKSELRPENDFESPLAHPSPRPFSRPIIQMPGTKDNDDAFSLDHHHSISGTSTTTSQGDYPQLMTKIAAVSLSCENVANIDGKRPQSPPPPGSPVSSPIVLPSSLASKWKTMW